MPITVQVATILMWILWVFGAVYIFSGWLVAMRAEYPSAVALTAIYVIILALLALLIRGVMKGRNWARLTYSVFAGIGIISIVLTWIHSGLVVDIGGSLLVVAYLMIMTLLYHRNSRAWFSRSVRNAA